MRKIGPARNGSELARNWLGGREFYPCFWCQIHSKRRFAASETPRAEVDDKFYGRVWGQNMAKMASRKWLGSGSELARQFARGFCLKSRISAALKAHAVISAIFFENRIGNHRSSRYLDKVANWARGSIW